MHNPCPHSSGSSLLVHDGWTELGNGLGIKVFGEGFVALLNCMLPWY